MRAWLLLLALLPLGAAVGATAGGAANSATRDSAADERALAKAIDGRTAGKSSFCIDQSRLNGPEVIDQRTIVYRQSGRRIWVSRLNDSCPWLHGDPILVVYTYGTQLCRHDRFEVLQRGSPIPSGFCFFGDFTPYDRAPKP